MRTTDTKEKILKEGRALLQKYGYNGFSFQDIANAVGIKKPSLYDHYESKDDLMIAILVEYGKLFEDWKAKVISLAPEEKIKSVFKVFYTFSCDHKKVCPVLALITDLKVLSKPVQNAMKVFIDNWLIWLTEVIKEGQNQKNIRGDIKAAELAQLIYGQIMGAQLQAKIKNDPQLIMDSSEIVSALIAKK